MMLRSAVLSILVLIVSACNTVPKDQANHSDQKIQTEATQDSELDWQVYALQAQTLDAFINALNNIIWNGNESAFNQVLLLPERSSVSVEGTENSSRGNIKINKPTGRLEYLTTTTVRVCPSLDDGEWTLVKASFGNDLLGNVFYRIENDDAYHWCRLTIKKNDGHYRITDLYDPVNLLSYSDLIHDFYVLDANPKIDFTPSKFKSGGFYRQYDAGLSAFDHYLQSAEVDISLPLIRTLRLQLIEAETDVELVQQSRRYFINDFGETALFSVRQLILNAQLNADKDLLLRNLKAAEKVTQDKSTLRSQVAMHLIGTEQQAFVEQLLNSAIMEEPTNDNSYLVYLEYYLEEQKYSDAVNILKILQHNFNYNFRRKHFIDNELYVGFVASSEFNEWLPGN